MITIGDTGFVISVVNKRDKFHEETSQVYQHMRKIYLPQTTLAEVAYLLSRSVGQLGVAKFLDNLPPSKFEVIPLISEDITKTAFILRKYADSRIDFVDATIMTITGRFHFTTILTLDQRDFSIYRPDHCSHFTLLL